MRGGGQGWQRAVPFFRVLRLDAAFLFVFVFTAALRRCSSRFNSCSKRLTATIEPP